MGNPTANYAIYALSFALIAIVFLIIALIRGLKIWSFRGAPRTLALVKDHKRDVRYDGNGKRKGNVIFLILTYSVDGRSYEKKIRSNVAELGTFPIGSKMEITYREHAPGRMICNHGNRLIKVARVLWIAAAIFLILAAAALLFSLRAGR